LKKTIILTIYCIFIFSAVCFAESPIKTNAELGLEVSHIQYREPGTMHDTGNMYGVAGAYKIHADKIVFSLNGRIAYGKVDYNGALMSGEPYTMSGIEDWIIEPRLCIGYDFAASKKVCLTPYVGVGYRYLFDGAGKDPNGYDREANYVYSPIGIDAIVDLKNGWSLGVTAEYDVFWCGIQRSHFEQLYPGDLDETDSDQRKGYGARGSIRIKKQLKAFDLVMEPYIRYWNIAQSDLSIVTAGNVPVGDGWEPKNNSTEYGVKIAASY